MYWFSLTIGFILISTIGFSQRIVSQQEAVNLALQNKINITPSALELQQQQQLLRSVGGIAAPEIGVEKTPYEKLEAVIGQRFSLPSVYRNQRALQNERIQLSQLLLQFNNYEISRIVRTAYAEIQYLQERTDQLRYQDSIYQSIKSAAQRNFEAGQINKLEELFATNQADRVRNELNRSSIDLQTRLVVFQYITNYNGQFRAEKLSQLSLDSILILYPDSLPVTSRQKILEQQVMISQQELRVQRSNLLPEITAGVLLPLGSGATSPLGYKLGLSLPVWARQNRSRINAARTGVHLTEAQRDRDLRNLTSEYQQALANLRKEQQSLIYYNSIALPQSREIIETSLRLFNAGQIQYIESLRNIITAFETQTAYLETLRNYNQAITELKFLNGTL